MKERIIKKTSRLIATKEECNFVDVRHLTENQLKALGVSQLAYVKEIKINGEPAFAIHAADGTPMAVTDTARTAYAAILQQEMMPIMVH